ncbi:Tim44 domain-containing protein [Sulfitobacter mediterraneus]|jgi:predicted lipid-binding transport protein (Tim44 family)|uniref:Tim44/TimA family putative adaptor protein n=1 Tax=Sulfitobacter TaxID=60136 RepID=UPI0019334A41|nr:MULTISPECIES: Tim44/TimA family putative adaptor protein [Sulfitobacter]MBM1632936.1 Tim44 domain-containing protein [Sulfitobacter mediterraneus]MBM1640930.1 Tim44 domain-containing protein [Sulfitobacter mediterraneus]MBM1644801.1 Tim44 domain-containing protein [Sulfitobacter mediterraneus]MBM1649050.1 Tim44 domain-containing protein [Sulfitobacter mediterraneus]MBM1653071.1 Tim44 domain-containing protein [Sulfitobacter mediterraneus]
MNSPIIQLLVLAGIAVFLILRLKNVLGTREGFEKPPVIDHEPARRSGPAFEVIEGGPDLDITDHVPEDSDAAKALAEMKRLEPSFGVSDFLGGARGAYEMIVMGYERGELAEIQPFLSEDIYESFVDGVAAREDQGLTIEANFIGVREMELVNATLDPDTKEAEMTIRFVAELTSAVRDRGGDIVEGSVTDIKRQKDTWVFARIMGSDDPNWLLVSTDG